MRAAWDDASVSIGAGHASKAIFLPGAGHRAPFPHPFSGPARANSCQWSALATVCSEGPSRTWLVRGLRDHGATSLSRSYTCYVKLPFHGQELVALVVAVSFAAGLNVYATVATLGLLAQAGVLPLPQALHLLASWWVIGASAALFAVEFFADKIPAFDLLWNALHTFIRVPVAALLAWRATATLTPGEQLAVTLVGGLIALAAHGGKTAARAAVTPSPEPFSNIGLSLGEDVLSVALTWLATRHPFVAASIATAFVFIIILLIRWVWSALGALFRNAEHTFQA